MRDDVRDVLEAERADVGGRIAELRRELDQLIQDSVGANADDEHDPEGATIAFERAQMSSVLEASGLGLSVQMRASAVSAMPSTLAARLLTGGGLDAAGKRV